VEGRGVSVLDNTGLIVLDTSMSCCYSSSERTRYTRGVKMTNKLTDILLSNALLAAYVEDKQVKIEGIKKPVKINYYSMEKVRTCITEAGVTVTDGAIRQRIYAVNKALVRGGRNQQWRAKRKSGTGRAKKQYDLSLFVTK